MDGLKVAKLSTRRELHRRLERARGFLHEHDGRNVSLAEMAAVAGLSQFHLARYFKAAFGKSPINYHRDLRLNRAAAMLAAGGSSVAEVAEATGYSDQVALSPRLPPPIRPAAAYVGERPPRVLTSSRHPSESWNLTSFQDSKGRRFQLSLE